jgi:hypothetical protein
MTSPRIRRLTALALPLLCLLQTIPTISIGSPNTLAVDGAWIRLDPDPRPSGRSGHTAIYDPVRDRMIVFGDGYFDGSTTHFLNDVWSLDLAGTPQWTELSPAGMPPSGRLGQCAIYDRMRDRMVIFGGYDGSNHLNDVWALSLAEPMAWTKLTPIGVAPSPRHYASAIYDPARDRMIIFGGSDGFNRFNDLSILSLGGMVWTGLTPAGSPAARMYSSAIFDSLGDQMILFGGAGNATQLPPSTGWLNDTWALSLSGNLSWTALTPHGALPTARYAQCAIYDPVRRRMVMFGGWDGQRRNDSWGLSLGDTVTWSELTPIGRSPTPRAGQSAIYDPIRDRMLVFAGTDSTSNRDDTWGLNWDAYVPTMVAIVNVSASADHVSLIWYSTAGAGLSGEVSRRGPGDAWLPMGAITSNGRGFLTFDDRDVMAGSRYAYQLAYWSDDTRIVTPEVLVDVPTTSAFALHDPRPNPVRGDLVVSFSLPSAAPAQIDVFDIAGRRVLSREVGAEGGSRQLNLSSGRVLPTGVFNIHLTQGDRRAVARAVVLR